ncbi:bleomycin hydrolase [Rhizoctonia solani AG-1 IB]|uniref:Cysteine proteinase 1, mitochondrial n=1 Tax=Thanatephorus cucumeris (strain AG1-IB / isolate 7/3/14) TaxID=1108050 RepID=A0A0B7FRJ9_THACB|nr:bleomycin hydrolase [Rhizoctonia solani AG-1 IB]
MGSAQSAATTPSADIAEKAVAEQKAVETLAQRVATLDVAGPVSADGSLSLDSLKSWEESTAHDDKLKLARTILAKSDLKSAISSPNVVVSDAHIFNLTVPFETGPVTNQKSSGRCWLFATTNVLRYHIIQQLNLGDFQLSQSYLFFADKLEKANYYLELSIEHASEPLDSRLISHLATAPINDGGQWDMARNLLERYGVVPQAVFPESYSSSNSGGLNSILTSRLREMALQLRDLTNGVGVMRARALKEEFIAEIWKAMSTAIGVPPRPDEKFVWDYKDKDGKVKSWEGTPREFYKAFTSKQYPALEAFSLINDPRNDYNKLYTVEALGNVWGMRSISYVNTESKRLKEAIVTCIKAGQPVFFGCDVGKFLDSPHGIMDLDVYDFKNALGLNYTLSKSQRLRTGDSAMTHAMVISGVHLDKQGNPVRYRIENSWGDVNGDKGYYVMTDRWFDEYVFQVVVPRQLASRDLVKVLDGGNPVVLPAWDPMGALA